MTDALLADTSLRAVIANVEMTGKHQFARQLSLVSGEDYGRVRSRTADSDRISEAYSQLVEAIGERLVFAEWPFDLAKIAQIAADHNADMLVLDYVQRIHADIEKPARDQRLEIDIVMSKARQIASEGRCVIAVSSLNRAGGGGNAKGDKYNSDIAQTRFRGSAELEFACNEGWILTRDNAKVTLHSVKQRDRQNFDIHLAQEPSLRFRPVDLSGVCHHYNEFDEWNNEQ